MIRFDRPVTELIAQRRSWRSYRHEPIEEDIKNRINDIISGLDPPPFGSKMRFSLIDAGIPEKKRVKGTYGVITGAGNFLAGALSPGAMAFEDFGYAMEALILFITSLDLGTCWIGGTLNRSYFGDKMALKEGEIIPAITPVGYVTERRSLLDSLFFLSAGSKNRKPMHELFFDGDFSTSAPAGSAAQYADALEMVRLAPSAVNKQPWRIVKKDGMFHFYLCRTRGYNTFSGDVDMQRIDLGIAMFHFHSCAREAGLGGRWEIIDPGISSLPKRTHYCVSWVPHT
jgi:nitroreductase